MVALSWDTAAGRETDGTDARQSPIARVVAHRESGAFAADWRAFQRSAWGTPYQYCDWVRAYADTLAPASGETIVVVAAHDAAGAMTALLPLALSRQSGLRIASFAGGKHANFHMPLIARSALAAFDGAACRTLLRKAADALGGIDVFAFTNQPAEWQGQANPFAALGGRPSPSNAYRLALDVNADDVLRKIMSSESRKKLRKKERRLEEIGPISARRASTPEEVEAILAAFFAQKAERFEQMGIEDPFATPAARAFLREASLAGLAEGAPAIELYGLCVGGQILATFAGTANGHRFCGMVNSFSPDPEVARSSPGEVLLVNVIQAQCNRGLETFDLGVGEAAYKSTVCDAVDELSDSFVPMTAAGALYATAATSVRGLKRWVKHTPWAMRLASRLISR